MVTYAKEEMVGVTELGKSLGSYLDKVVSNPFNKIVIIRHNKPEAIMIPISEYEHMRAAADYLEEIEIAGMLKERVFNRTAPAKMISQEEMEEYFRKRGIGDV